MIDYAEEHFGGIAANYDVLKQRPRGQPSGSPPEVKNGDLVEWNNLLTLIGNDLTIPANYAAVEPYINFSRVCRVCPAESLGWQFGLAAQ